MVSSFGIIVLDSKKNKDINLYNDYIENKLVFEFVATEYNFCLQSWDLTKYTKLYFYPYSHLHIHVQA